MADPAGSVFLARHSYRRRRLTDAARLLPLLGMLALLAPVLWQDGASTAEPGAARLDMRLVYLFGVWAALIGAAGWLSVRLGAMDGAPERPAASGARAGAGPDAPRPNRRP